MVDLVWGKGSVKSVTAGKSSLPEMLGQASHCKTSLPSVENHSTASGMVNNYSGQWPQL